MCSEGVVSKPQSERLPKHNVHFLHPCVIGLELGSLAWSACHVLRGQGDETARWTGDKTSSQCTFSPFQGHWLEAHVMRSGGSGVETTRWTRDKTSSQCTIFSIPAWLAWSSCQVLWGPGAETTRWTGNITSSQCTIVSTPVSVAGNSCHVLYGLVPKPQSDRLPKPAHNVHFLDPCVIGLELMSGAWGPGAETTRWTWNKTSLQSTIFSIPVSLAANLCHAL